MFRTILIASLLAACTHEPEVSDVHHPELTTPQGKACLHVAYAWCDSSFECDRSLDNLRQCVETTFASCSTWEPAADIAARYDAVADECAADQTELACVDEGGDIGYQLENTPPSITCLERFVVFK